MERHDTPLTPEQARERLRLTRARTLPSAGDRRAHAIGTAVCGLTVGVHLGTQSVLSGTGRLVLLAALVAVFVAEAVWVERAARTVPRHAGLSARVGVGASLVLALVVVLPWLDASARTEPNSWPLVLTAAVVVALPSLVAAAAIVRGRP